MSPRRWREAAPFLITLGLAALATVLLGGCDRQAEGGEAITPRAQREVAEAAVEAPSPVPLPQPSEAGPDKPDVASVRDLARCQRLTRDQEVAERFPLPREIEPNARFWLRIFTEWRSDQYVLHDSGDPTVIYGVVKAGHGRDPAVKRAKKRVDRALARLNRKRPRSSRGLRGAERDVYDALGQLAGPRAYKHARDRVRAQRGQADIFARALTESGRYRGEVEATLEQNGAPAELLAIAFIESMFQLGVRSHAGALGPWQFMPATGREYLNINRVVDERRDPIIATQAAATYLSTAHRRLGSWPLAITSYNYGMNGMARAVKKTRSSDLSKILRRHRDQRLGFAVKNYYAEFVAALHVLDNVATCFPALEPVGPWEYEVVQMPSALTVDKLVKAEAVSRAVLADLNPALTSAALDSQVRLPRGMTLRMPGGMGEHFERALAVAGHGRPAAAPKPRVHVVKAGDNVTRIARMHGVTVGAVLAANQLGWDSPIYPAMRLAIPAPGSGTTALKRPPAIY